MGNALAEKIDGTFGCKNSGHLKPSTIYHERCRAIAELLWSLEPELTVAEMARKDEITRFGCEGQVYDVRTICRWLASLKKERQPGRPRINVIK